MTTKNEDRLFRFVVFLAVVGAVVWVLSPLFK
jgi:hypothetical protein